MSVAYAGSYAIASASLTVLAAAPDSVARVVLAPATVTVEYGANITFDAIALDAVGKNVTSLSSFRWQLVPPALGTLVYAPGH
ncbi:MAG: hypothetical protein L3J91_03505, partial [Thermoplasmata archaeon]|nr:hypothetical protein [Thermoplasmata archaeon]